MGFTVHSLLTRLPIVLAPSLGGLLIGSIGLVAGVRVGFTITVVLGMLSLLAPHRFSVDAPLEAPRPAPLGLRRSLHALPVALKRLRLAESSVRIGQGLAEICVVL
jgi:hypothetical protein